jgi:hypothetical protein
MTGTEARAKVQQEIHRRTGGRVEDHQLSALEIGRGHWAVTCSPPVHFAAGEGTGSHFIVEPDGKVKAYGIDETAGYLGVVEWLGR